MKDQLTFENSIIQLNINFTFPLKQSCHKNFEPFERKKKKRFSILYRFPTIKYSKIY